MAHYLNLLFVYYSLLWLYIIKQREYTTLENQIVLFDSTENHADTQQSLFCNLATILCKYVRPFSESTANNSYKTRYYIQIF